MSSMPGFYDCTEIWDYQFLCYRCYPLFLYAHDLRSSPDTRATGKGRVPRLYKVDLHHTK